MKQRAENNTVTSRSRLLLRWLLAVLCLTGVPAALVFFAAFRYYTVSEDELKFSVTTQLQRAANEASLSIDQEAFWCRMFYEQFNTFEADKTAPGLILSWLEQQQRLFPGEFEYIAWSPDGKELIKTFSDDYSSAEWLEVFKYFCDNPGLQPRFPKLEYDTATARRIIGPQLIPAMLSAQNDPERFSLAWLDSSFNRPPITRHFISTIGVVIRYDQTKLKQRNGLKHSLQKFSGNSRITLGLVSAGKNKPDIIWHSDDIAGSGLSPQVFADCENKSTSFLELPRHYLGYLFLSPDLRIFALAAKGYSQSGVIWRSLLFAIFYCALMSPFLIYTWNTMVADRPGRATIKTRLAFLFFFASGIPLLAMMVISHEHNSQMRRTLMSEAHQNSIDTILRFDRRFLSFLHNDATALDRLFDDWAEKVRGKEFTIEIAQAINNELKSFAIGNYYLVASESKSVISLGDLLVLKGGFDAASVDREKSQTKREITTVVENDVVAANLVGKKVMSDLNSVEISAQTLSKLEIIAESLLQQTILEMTNSVIGNLGKINNWGFGRVNDLSFIKLISSITPGLVDYSVMIFWRPMAAQTRFIQKTVALTNRNASGIKLITRNRISNTYLPEIATQATALRQFANRLGSKPTEEIELLKLDGEEYIAVGFNGRNVGLFQIIALYPLRNIDRVIGQQKTELILFVLFSVILAASLAQILAGSFIEPLHALRDSALAIENREFSHRIRKVGKDEFGEVATIFNDVMVGFEELEVARIVQDSLFPQPLFEQGCFVTFGKSISMSELGGDYFDFFPVDDQHLAVLAGDVAGHGVGAALIMAMAKAGILSSPNLLSAPAELLQALHKMILASKSRQQKKVMTFQYLYLDSKAGNGLYSNAGGCSPMLIRAAEKSVEEFTLAGPALGAFSKAKYLETAIQFAAGDAIVFYTDGIIEARSPVGGEIGYEGFKSMLHDCYDADPQIFYQNIYAAYMQHIGSSEAEDDLTIIITVCRPPAEPS